MEIPVIFDNVLAYLTPEQSTDLSDGATIEGILKDAIILYLVCLSVCLSLYLSIHLSVHLFNRNGKSLIVKHITCTLYLANDTLVNTIGKSK